MTDHIRADCTIPVREVERLREIEARARAVVSELSSDYHHLDGTEISVLESLRAALEGK